MTDAALLTHSPCISVKRSNPAPQEQKIKIKWMDFLCEKSETTMERDRKLFQRVKNEEDKLIIRFYSWKNKTVSYGKTQGIDSKLKEDMINKGWDMVQRLTGGGIVLHENDICFTLVWKKEDRIIPWKILDSYEAIHQWVQISLKKMKIESILFKPNSKKNLNESRWCFKSAVGFDLMMQNKKIVGGAQWRDGNTAIHQGSIQWNELPIPLLSSEKWMECFKISFEKKFGAVTA